MNVIIRAAVAVALLFTCSVVSLEVVKIHSGQSVQEACGRSGPSCRHCFPGVYTAQCPK